ncbi:hypothetical protein G9A89_015055 [Geosiphon pyriformis]|nr:hypothetical protein G9A89_015055 [Geosiphon pyriformis]
MLTQLLLWGINSTGQNCQAPQETWINLSETWTHALELEKGIVENLYKVVECADKCNDYRLQTLIEERELACISWIKNFASMMLAIPSRSPSSVNRILGNHKNNISSDKKISCQEHSQKWSVEEIKTLLEAYRKYGSQWKLISQKYLLSRTSRAIEAKSYRLTANGKIIKQKLTLSLNKWTPEEDKELYLAAKRYLINNKVDWKAIVLTGLFPGRNNRDLYSRYHNVLVYPKRDPWTEQEEEKLKSFVQRYGKKWAEISHILQRPPNYIKKHYNNHLVPGIKRNKWTYEEYNKLAKAFQTHGENWEQIQLLIPGKSLNQIKYHCRHSPKVQSHYNSGEWNPVETKSLIQAFRKYGRNWVKISKAVNTRNSNQCWKKMEFIKRSDV